MIRIATFNLENLEEDLSPDSDPTFEERAEVIRPMLERIRAEIICFQEVNGQEREGEPRNLLALQALLKGTRYQDYPLVSTMTTKNEVFNSRNLVTAFHPQLTLAESRQIRHDIVDQPIYRTVTGGDGEPRELSWERPLLYTRLTGPDGDDIHIINVHFKSKLPSNVPGQKVDNFTWRTAGGWAEGFFLASVRRVGAALEARVFVDQIQDEDPNARIVVTGDFNALSEEVPVMALRGRVEETGNAALANRVLVPLEDNVPESKRFTLYHRGRGEMIDHVLVSRPMLAHFIRTEIHNEILPDESIAFATDRKFPEPDHAPVVACFETSLIPGLSTA